MKVNIVDSIMGSGKTSAIINMINDSNDGTKFMYITPYLDEVKRIEDSCATRKFKQPISINGKKINGIKKLLINGNNIVSTHSLFHLFDDEIFDLIRTKQYILIMDEVTDVVEPYRISKDDINIIFSEKLAHIDESNYVVWDEESYKGRFTEFKNLCDIQSICSYKDSLFMWLFPIKSFEVFSEIFILTYIFDGQIQKWYYDFYGVEYEWYKAAFINNKYCIVKGFDTSKLDKSLINICDNKKMNLIGENVVSLSKTWYEKAIKNKLINEIKSNTENYFRNITKVKSNQILWTTFKDYEKRIKGKGYTKGFIPLNLRASNKYRERDTCAYLVNRYINPLIAKFFEYNNIEIDQDKFALSEMLQWIWRSCIRDGKPIQVYIPSKRMRNLLIEWLED